MRLPTRRSEKLKKVDESPVYLTREGIVRLKRKIARLERDLPAAIAETRRTAEMGDLSENAAYQIAKATMRRMQNSVLASKERLKQVIEIAPDPHSDVVQLGSTVVILTDGEEYCFRLVGPLEADPLRGAISYVSPLGAGLLGSRAGEDVTLALPTGNVVYKIIKVEV